MNLSPETEVIGICDGGAFLDSPKIVNESHI